MEGILLPRETSLWEHPCKRLQPETIEIRITITPYIGENCIWAEVPECIRERKQAQHQHPSPSASSMKMQHDCLSMPHTTTMQQTFKLWIKMNTAFLKLPCQVLCLNSINKENAVIQAYIVYLNTIDKLLYWPEMNMF